jgi:hypothetical protein
MEWTERQSWCVVDLGVGPAKERGKQSKKILRVHVAIGQGCGEM